MSSSTALSAGRLPWMSLNIATRMFPSIRASQPSDRQHSHVVGVGTGRSEIRLIANHRGEQLRDRLVRRGRRDLEEAIRAVLLPRAVAALRQTVAIHEQAVTRGERQ